jgi:hypothetical protein
VAGFHATHLARRTHQALCDLLYRQAFLIAKSAEEGTEFATANGGATHFRQRRSFPSSGVASEARPAIPTFGTVQTIRA